MLSHPDDSNSREKGVQFAVLEESSHQDEKDMEAGKEGMCTPRRLAGHIASVLRKQSTEQEVGQRVTQLHGPDLVTHFIEVPYSKGSKSSQTPLLSGD